MRPRSLLLVAAAVFFACYQQPAIPKDRPLPCASSETTACPTGFVCVANRLCAPRSCRSDGDCPLGLVCDGTRGCQLPADARGRDGGQDGGDFRMIPPDGGRVLVDGSEDVSADLSRDTATTSSDGGSL